MSLIERLEAAEVGSREFDLLIDAELFGGEPWPNSDRVYRKDGNGYGYTQAVAPYTSSLDAALVLFERVVTLHGPIDMSIMGSAQVVIHADDACANVLSEAYGKSPALALCVAILKAKETK